MRFLSSAAVCAAALVRGITAAHPTDEYRDADPQQTGYLPNHNLDPAVVNSTQFGLLWKVPFNDGERVRISSVASPAVCAKECDPGFCPQGFTKVANALEA